VRELRRVVECAVLLAHGPMIDAAAIEQESDEMLDGLHAPAHGLNAIIRRAVRETVELCDGNKSDAARRLGISRTRLQRLLAGERRTESPSAVTSPT
jgi:DNA-binding NtrC family response regulator